MKLSDLSRYAGGVLIGEDVSVARFCIDSREIQASDVFIARTDGQRDGHEFIPAAIKAGAGAVIHSANMKLSCPSIQVKDTIQAMDDIAKAIRHQSSAITFAITGSCGKTTSRSLLQAICQEAGPTHASIRSYNNNVGVPYSMMHLTDKHQYYVQEVGANDFGEITDLLNRLKPSIGMITNASEAHLSGFGSVAGVAKAKGEMITGLDETGIVILNQDDASYDYWRGLLKKRRCYCFSTKTSTADITASNIQLNDALQPSFDLRFPDESVRRVQLAMIGEHNVSNALAAAAAAYAAGINVDNIERGLTRAHAEVRRLVPSRGYQGALLIDDSYNANLGSVKAAIDVLVKTPGETFFVLGDLLELGDLSVEIHQQIGRLLNDKHIDHVFTLGDSARHVVSACGSQAKHFEDQSALIEALKPLLHDTAVVMVKGSNGMRMDRIVNALSEVTA